MMSGACSRYVGEERCLEGFNWATCGRHHLQDLAVDGMMMIIIITIIIIIGSIVPLGT